MERTTDEKDRAKIMQSTKVENEQFLCKFYQKNTKSGHKISNFFVQILPDKNATMFAGCPGRARVPRGDPPQESPSEGDEGSFASRSVRVGKRFVNLEIMENVLFQGGLQETQKVEADGNEGQTPEKRPQSQRTAQEVQEVVF